MPKRVDHSRVVRYTWYALDGGTYVAWEVFALSKRMLIVVGVLVVVAVLYFIQNGKKGNAQQTGQAGCQVQVTADKLNVRSGPAATDKIVHTFATGAIIAATSTVQNGFRELATNQWASNQFLKSVSGPC